MSSISFKEIYASFYLKTEGYDLFDPNLSKEMRNDLMCGYIHSALSDRYVSRLFSSITVTDSVIDNGVEIPGVIDYTLKYGVGDFFDKHFLVEMLGYGMALAWVTPKVNSLTNLAMLVTDSQTKFYSQASHLDKLMNLRERIKNERNELIVNRGFINNSYLDGASTFSNQRSAT